MSAQKARLVVDVIRGQQVDRAFAFLRHSKKAVAADILKLLRSAVANTENGPEGALVDTENVYVHRAAVDCARPPSSASGPRRRGARSRS